MMDTRIKSFQLNTNFFAVSRVVAECGGGNRNARHVYYVASHTPFRSIHACALSRTMNILADKVVESFLVQLARTLDPVAVSTRLLSANIIDERTWEKARVRDVSDYDRNLDVLKAVRKRVRADVEYFHKFCDQLEEEEYTTTVAENMKGEQCPPFMTFDRVVNTNNSYAGELEKQATEETHETKSNSHSDAGIRIIYSVRPSY